MVGLFRSRNYLLLKAAPSRIGPSGATCLPIYSGDPTGPAFYWVVLEVADELPCTYMWSPKEFEKAVTEDVNG
jgi:hypothetical protein